MYVSQSYGLKCLSSPSKVLAWILRTSALRLEEVVQEVSVEPRPPQPCRSCWTDFVNAEPAAMPEKEPAAPSPCRFIKQLQPQVSDGEPRPSLSAQKTSRSPGPAPASSNRPPRSCLALPVLAPSVMLRHLLPPLQLEPNSLASTPVIPSLRFPRCPASPPWRPPSPLAISLPPCPSQRRTQMNPSAL